MSIEHSNLKINILEIWINFPDFQTAEDNHSDWKKVKALFAGLTLQLTGSNFTNLR